MLLLGWWVHAAWFGLSGALVLIARLSTQRALKGVRGSVPSAVTGACCKVFLFTQKVKFV